MKQRSVEAKGCSHTHKTIWLIRKENTQHHRQARGKRHSLGWTRHATTQSRGTPNIRSTYTVRLTKAWEKAQSRTMNFGSE